MPLLCWQPAERVPPPLPKSPQAYVRMVQQGAIAAMISAGVTALISLTGALGFTSWLLIDAGIILLCAWGLTRLSRTAALVLLVHYVVGQMLLRIDGQVSGGGMIALGFLVLYVRAVWGTVQWHRLQRPQWVSLKPGRHRDQS